MLGMLPGGGKLEQMMKVFHGSGLRGILSVSFAVWGLPLDRGGTGSQEHLFSFPSAEETTRFSPIQISLQQPSLSPLDWITAMHSLKAT